MKKILLSVVCLIMVGVLCILSSCSNEKQDVVSYSQKPVNGYTKGVMTSTEQKNYIEDVALELMNMMPASDFEDILNLGRYICNTYGDNFYWENMGDWVKNIFDVLRQPLNTETWDSKTYYTYSGTLSRYDYIYTDYKALLLISNFAGHFIAHNGRWEIEEADDIQFIFKDKAGKQCVLKLTTSGQEKRVYAYNLIRSVNYNYEMHGSTYISSTYYDRIQCTIGIPENITIELLQGGHTVFQSHLHTDISSLNDNTFDLSTSELTVSCITKLSNNYTFTLSQFSYEGNKRLNASYVAQKGDTPLITIAMASDVKDLPSVGTHVFSDKNFEKLNDLEPGNILNTFFKIDIIGRIQLYGAVKDIRKYINLMREANANNYNETYFKSCVAQANTFTDIQLFYDGNDERQATIWMESFYSRRSWKYSWNVEPVIVFDDESAYASFSAFFNEEDFSKTIDTFKMITDRYANLANIQIKW